MILDPILPVTVLLVAAAALGGFSAWRLTEAATPAARLAWALRVAAVLLLLIVALRPVVPAQPTARPTSSGGLEVYIVADTTSSMAAEDWAQARPRLDGVKADIRSIATGLPGASFSLVTFDADTVQRVPLTSDATALVSAADVLSQEVTAFSRGSSVDEPVEFLAGLLGDAAAENPDQERVLFYLGDGEQTAASEPGSFAPLSRFLSGGAVLGYGTAGGGRMLEFTGYTDPELPAGYIMDPSSGQPQPAVSRIDETRLRAIAVQLGVAYALRSADTPIAPVLAPIDVGDVTVTDPAAGQRTELYWIPAALLALLALAELLRLAGTLAELRTALRRDRRAT